MLPAMSCCSQKMPTECRAPAPRAVAAPCCGSAPAERGLPPDIWLRLGISLVVAGQNMVWGLAFNLSRPAQGSQEYLIGHGWMILSTLLVAALLGPMLATNAWNMLSLRRLTVEGLFLLTAAGAFVASLLSTFTGTGAVYYEVVAVVLVIYTTGAFLGDRARSRTREAVRHFEEQYDRARRLEADGRETDMEVRDLRQGDRVLIYPGEAVPVDGVIIEGRAFLHEATLTGEPLPRAAGPGDRTRAGGWSADGRLVVEVGGDPARREIDRLLEILDSARERPSRLQRHADRITQWFLPLVAAISLFTFIGWWFFVPWPQALFNSMAVLLVACPCALGLATPIAVWSGLWRLLQMGIVSRSATLIDGLAETRKIYFDKTGTLSESDLDVAACEMVPGEAGYSMDPQKVATLVLALEEGQKHPAARALASWASAVLRQRGAPDPEMGRLENVRTIPGTGVRADLEMNGMPVTVNLGVDPGVQNRVALEVAGRPWAHFELRERLRPEISGLFDKLRVLGVDAEILTGDPSPRREALPGVVIHAGCSAEDKKARVAASREAGVQPLFVGDGVNDTAAMQEAAASLAMQEGTNLAQSVGTGVLLGASLVRIPEAVAMARAIQKTLRQNLVFAACYNFAGISLAVAGLLHPVVAALLMLLSSAMVSVRAARSAEKSTGKQGSGKAAIVENESQKTKALSDLPPLEIISARRS